MWAVSPKGFADVAQTAGFIVAIAIEVLSPKGFGRARLQHVNDVSAASLVPFVSGAVELGSEVRTEGWKGYNGLSRQGYRHHATSISESGDPAHVSMPGVHKVASLLAARNPPGIRDCGAPGCLSQ